MKKEKVYYSDLFKKIANAQKTKLNREMSDKGHTYVQSLVILYLASMKEQFGQEYEVSQKDVENYLSLKGSTVTLLLSRMEESEDIIRKKSERDCRSNQLNPTEKGLKSIPLFFQILDDLEERMTMGMDEYEKRLLKSLLQRVQANLEDNTK